MASTGTSCNTCDSSARRSPYMGMTGGSYYDDDQYGQSNRFMGSSAGGQGYNNGMYGDASNDQYGYDTYQFDDDDYSDMQFANDQKMSMDELRQFRSQVAQSEDRDEAGRFIGRRLQGTMQFQSGDDNSDVIIDKNGRKHDRAGRFLPEDGMSFRSNTNTNTSSQRRSGSSNRRSGNRSMNFNNGSYGGSSGGGYGTGNYNGAGSGSGSFGGNTGNGYSGSLRFRSGGSSSSANNGNSSNSYGFRYRSGNGNRSNRTSGSRSNY